MSLWDDIEQVCRTIKHAPEQVDMEEVRVLLRRMQSAQDAFYPFQRPDTMTVGSLTDGGYMVSLTSYMSPEQYQSMLEQMVGFDDSAP